jgi:hypothetical protein
LSLRQNYDGITQSLNNETNYLNTDAGKMLADSEGGYFKNNSANKFLR